MDDAIDTLRNVVSNAIKYGNVSVEVSTKLLDELFRRLDRTPVSIRQVPESEMLLELARRAALRERYPHAMKTLESHTPGASVSEARPGVPAGGLLNPARTSNLLSDAPG